MMTAPADKLFHGATPLPASGDTRPYIIAIAPDEATLGDGSADSASDRWCAHAEALGHIVRRIDLNHPNVIEHIRGADGFMHRFLHPPDLRNKGRRIVAAVEQGLGIPVFPDFPTSWHYDDKVAQKYLLEAAGIPIPTTWVGWTKPDALAFARSAAYPLVLKLSGGASSQNVQLVEDQRAAEHWIHRLFGEGAFSLAPRYRPSLRTPDGRRTILNFVRSGEHPDPGFWYNLNKNYILFQEFLPHNDFDTRVMVVGKRAFSYRRFNRPNDFRASGNSNYDVDPAGIDPELIHIAFKVARQLGLSVVAIDGLRRGRQWVVGEISYSYIGPRIWECPGHWELEGDPGSGNLNWVDGQGWPEVGIFDDFVERIRCFNAAR